MTTTSEYLNEFTPDWPHGHVLVDMAPRDWSATCDAREEA